MDDDSPRDSSGAPRFFAIVPAAGRSARMGRPKLLLPWGGMTLVEHVLQQWRNSRVSQVVAVVHADDVALAEICRHAGAQVVVPEVPPPEMKSSVLAALDWIAARHAPRQSDAWLLAPADMPGLNPRLIDSVILRHNALSPRIVLPVSGGRRGHPVLFPWPLANDAKALTAGQGLNALVNRGPIVEVAWSDSAALADVDDPGDYERLRPGPRP